MKPLMLLVLYFIDKVKRFRLSREAKNKAEKNRSKVAELFWKSIHAARAERAQEERERKRKFFDFWPKFYIVVLRMIFFFSTIYFF